MGEEGEQGIKLISLLSVQLSHASVFLYHYNLLLVLCVPSWGEWSRVDSLLCSGLLVVLTFWLWLLMWLLVLWLFVLI